MKTIQDLRVKIFSDGAKIEDFKALSAQAFVKGFTTNPSLMNKAGVKDYAQFIEEVLPIVKEKPISFEVFSDDFKEMKRQALKLRGLGGNIYVKIPITNTKGESSLPLIKELTHGGMKINVTAILTLKQVEQVAAVLHAETPSVVSVFAGRIADTGIDPIPVMKQSKALLKSLLRAELLWASSRELLNIFHAEEAGSDIITVPPDLLKKISFIGYDLKQFSLDTVKMFYTDAVSSGFQF